LPRPISQLPSSLLQSAEQAPLPAALAGLLVAVVVAHLLLPIDAELPEVATPPVTRSALAAVTIAPATIDPVIMASPIFAPSRSGAGGAAAVADGELRLLGTASRRGAVVAIVAIGSETLTLRGGETAGRWRLVAVGRDRAVFEGEGGRRLLRIGEGGEGGQAGGAPQPLEISRPEED